MMKSRKKGGAAVVLVSILCFLLVMVLSAALVGQLTLRHCAGNALLPKAVAEVPIADITVDNRSVAQIIYDEFVADERVSVENVERVIEQGTFSAYAEEVAAAYNRYLLGEGEFPQLEAEEIVTLIDENAELIYAETGLRFLDADKEKLRTNLEGTLADYNRTLENGMHKGVNGFAVRSAFSLWLPIVLGVLMLLLLIWMFVLYIRRQCRVGTALKVYGVAMFIPCVLLLIGTLISTPLLGRLLTAIAADFAIPFTGAMLPYAGTGTAIAVLLFVIGVICNRVSRKKQRPAAEEVPESVTEATAAEAAMPAEAAVPSVAAEATAAEQEKVEEEVPEAQRRFCRNCGQPLVNPDAKFCYKCGNVQEHTVQQETEV